MSGHEDDEHITLDEPSTRAGIRREERPQL